MWISLSRLEAGLVVVLVFVVVCCAWALARMTERQTIRRDLARIERRTRVRQALIQRHAEVDSSRPQTRPAEGPPAPRPVAPVQEREPYRPRFTG